MNRWVKERLAHILRTWANMYERELMCKEYMEYMSRSFSIFFQIGMKRCSYKRTKEKETTLDCFIFLCFDFFLHLNSLVVYSWSNRSLVERRVISFTCWFGRLSTWLTVDLIGIVPIRKCLIDSNLTHVQPIYDDLPKALEESIHPWLPTESFIITRNLNFKDKKLMQTEFRCKLI